MGDICSTLLSTSYFKVIQSNGKFRDKNDNSNFYTVCSDNIKLYTTLCFDVIFFPQNKEIPQNKGPRNEKCYKL